VADLLAHGFTNTLLDRLARDGLATIQPGTMHAGTRRITVWVTITDAGQRALADNLGWPVG
jgi:DNA-binding PadR family transcriptional regulator